MIHTTRNVMLTLIIIIDIEIGKLIDSRQTDVFRHEILYDDGEVGVSRDDGRLKRVLVGVVEDGFISTSK